MARRKTAYYDSLWTSEMPARLPSKKPPGSQRTIAWTHKTKSTYFQHFTPILGIGNTISTSGSKIKWILRRTMNCAEFLECCWIWRAPQASSNTQCTLYCQPSRVRLHFYTFSMFSWCRSLLKNIWTTFEPDQDYSLGQAYQWIWKSASTPKTVSTPEIIWFSEADIDYRRKWMPRSLE